MAKDPAEWLQSVFEAGTFDPVADAMRFESVAIRSRRSEEKAIRQVKADTIERRARMGVAGSETPNGDAGVRYAKHALQFQRLWLLIGKHQGKHGLVADVVNDRHLARMVMDITGAPEVSLQSIADATRDPMFQAFKEDTIHLRALSADLSALDTLNEVVARAIAREERYETAIAENAALRNVEQEAWREQNESQADTGVDDLGDALQKAGFDE